MPGKRFTWRGPEYRKRLVKEVGKNLLRAGAYLERDIKQAFPDSGIAGTRSGATKAQRASNRSKPGGIPHVDTGNLKSSIGFVQIKPLLVRVGSGIGGKKDPGYAFYLEFGTKALKGPRPYLRPAIKRNRARLRKLISRKVHVRMPEMPEGPGA